MTRAREHYASEAFAALCGAALSGDRAASTLIHTAIAAAWAWEYAGARAIGAEVGLSADGTFGTPYESRWRIDLIAAGWSSYAASPRQRIDVFEIKGCRADFAREQCHEGKWTQMPSHVRPWLVCPDDCVYLAEVRLPKRWGILRSADNGLGAYVVRKAEQGPDAPSALDPVAWAATLGAIARCGVSGAMPSVSGRLGMVQLKGWPKAERLARAIDVIATVHAPAWKRSGHVKRSNRGPVLRS